MFLELNGVYLRYTQGELVNIILEIASGTKTEKELLSWLMNHQA
jgi:death-on-curing protein